MPSRPASAEVAAGQSPERSLPFLLSLSFRLAHALILVASHIVHLHARLKLLLYINNSRGCQWVNWAGLIRSAARQGNEAS